MVLLVKKEGSALTAAEKIKWWLCPTRWEQGDFGWGEYTLLRVRRRIPRKRLARMGKQSGVRILPEEGIVLSADIPVFRHRPSLKERFFVPSIELLSSLTCIGAADRAGGRRGTVFFLGPAFAALCGADPDRDPGRRKGIAAGAAAFGRGRRGDFGRDRAACRKGIGSGSAGMAAGHAEIEKHPPVRRRKSRRAVVLPVGQRRHSAERVRPMVPVGGISSGNRGGRTFEFLLQRCLAGKRIPDTAGGKGNIQ